MKNVYFLAFLFWLALPLRAMDDGLYNDELYNKVQELHGLISRGNLQGLQMYLAQEGNQVYVNELRWQRFGDSMLEVACGSKENKSALIIKELHRAGAQGISKNGRPIFIYMASSLFLNDPHYEDKLDVLLEHYSALMDKQDEEGYTALMWYCKWGWVTRVDSALKLLVAGADPNIESRAGQTALDLIEGALRETYWEHGREAWQDCKQKLDPLLKALEEKNAQRGRWAFFWCAVCYLKRARLAIGAVVGLLALAGLIGYVMQVDNQEGDEPEDASGEGPEGEALVPAWDQEEEGFRQENSPLGDV